MNIVSIAIVLAIALSGCGIAAKVNARNGMEQSRDAYKACLVQNPNSPQACESARLAYQADLQAFQATSSSLQPGNNDTVNINTSVIGR